MRRDRHAISDGSRAVHISMVASVVHVEDRRRVPAATREGDERGTGRGNLLYTSHGCPLPLASSWSRPDPSVARYAPCASYK